MLLKIRDYMRSEKVASNQQLAREFQLDLAALQPMLDIWLDKGVITRCNQPASCKSRCSSKCQSQPPVYYQYLGSVN